MSILTEEIERALNQISIFLQEDIKQILIDEGHNASGDLVRSIKNTVVKGPDNLSIEGEMLIYGGAIIKGRKRGTKRIPVDALIKYLNDLNFSRGVKETRGVAFNIQKRIFEEGIKEDDFLETAFEKNEGLIDRTISDATETALDLALTNLITNAQQFA